VNVAAEVLTGWSAKIRRIIRAEVYLTEIAENSACTKQSDLVVRVLSGGQVFQLDRIMPAVVARSDVARLKRGKADWAV
jgi:hypothetical protein